VRDIKHAHSLRAARPGAGAGEGPSVKKRACVSPLPIELYFEDIRVVVLEKLRSFAFDTNHGALVCWVRELASNEARRSADRLYRHRPGSLPTESVDALIDPEPAAAHGQLIERDEVQSILSRLCARVPALTYKMVVMYWIDGQSGPEIATALGVSQHCVTRGLHKARDVIERLIAGDPP
jgi:DNA-directed RNA polymerase specialized sigma24 family protein